MDEAGLWAAIEAAGPAGRFEPFDPLTVDDVLQAERNATQYDRRRSFIASYAWAIPTPAAIGRIRDLLGERKLLEVCAGNGLWAHLLSRAGACVVATDQSPPPGATATFYTVQPLEAEAAVRQYDDCGALFLCWPPFKDECGFRALRAFQGDLLVYAGDVRFTAEARFHSLLKASWQLIDEMPLPSWPGTKDGARVYARRAGDGT